MGTTLTGALVGDDEVSDRARRRQPRVPVPRRAAAPAHPRPLARRGAAPPGPADAARRRRSTRSARSSRARSAPSRTCELDVHTHQARSGDVFLLCSDGLTSMVREDRVQRDHRGAATRLRAAADRLVGEANEMGGRDNITVVLFRLGGDERGRAAGPGADETVVGLRRRVEADTEHARGRRPPQRRGRRPPAPPRRAEPAAGAQAARRPVKRVVATLLVLAVLARGWSWARTPGHAAGLLRRPGRPRPGARSTAAFPTSCRSASTCTSRATSARCRRRALSAASGAACWTTSCARATTPPSSCGGSSGGAPSDARATASCSACSRSRC